MFVDGPQQRVRSEQGGCKQGHINRAAAEVLQLLSLYQCKRLCRRRDDGGAGDRGNRGALVRWAERISAWSRDGEPSDVIKAEPRVKPALRPRAVYCYFDNTDAKLRAPADAITLMKKLGLRWKVPPN